LKPNISLEPCGVKRTLYPRSWRGTLPDLTTLIFALVITLSGCAGTPPVQEMSDARQAIQAAKEVDATSLAPQALESAELSLERAARELDLGNYRGARSAALEAKEKAIAARDKAVSNRQP
jgi:hypothetical protein